MSNPLSKRFKVLNFPTTIQQIRCLPNIVKSSDLLDHLFWRYVGAVSENVQADSLHAPREEIVSHSIARIKAANACNVFGGTLEF